MTREEKYIQFFTTLTSQNLDKIDGFFTTDAHFKDPFNNVTGIDAIKNIFIHMFNDTKDPKFIVDQHASNDEVLFLQWRCTFNKNNTDWLINGSSVATFNKNDLVIDHVDYWDPAEEIYSKIAFIRPVMNLLKSRLTAK